MDGIITIHAKWRPLTLHTPAGLWISCECAEVAARIVVPNHYGIAAIIMWRPGVRRCSMVLGIRNGGWVGSSYECHLCGKWSPLHARYTYTQIIDSGHVFHTSIVRRGPDGCDDHKINIYYTAPPKYLFVTYFRNCFAPYCVMGGEFATHLRVIGKLLLITAVASMVWTRQDSELHQRISRFSMELRGIYKMHEFRLPAKRAPENVQAKPPTRPHNPPHNANKAAHICFWFALITSTSHMRAC